MRQHMPAFKDTLNQIRGQGQQLQLRDGSGSEIFTTQTAVALLYKRPAIMEVP